MCCKNAPPGCSKTLRLDAVCGNFCDCERSSQRLERGGYFLPAVSLVITAEVTGKAVVQYLSQSQHGIVIIVLGNDQEF